MTIPLIMQSPTLPQLAKIAQDEGPYAVVAHFEAAELEADNQPEGLPWDQIQTFRVRILLCPGKEVFMRQSLRFYTQPKDHCQPDGMLRDLLDTCRAT